MFEKVDYLVLQGDSIEVHYERALRLRSKVDQHPHLSVLTRIQIILWTAKLTAYSNQTVSQCWFSVKPFSLKCQVCVRGKLDKNDYFSSSEFLILIIRQVLFAISSLNSLRTSMHPSNSWSSTNKQQKNWLKNCFLLCRSRKKDPFGGEEFKYTDAHCIVHVWEGNFFYYDKLLQARRE